MNERFYLLRAMKCLLFVVSILLVACTKHPVKQPSIRYTGYSIPIEGGRITMKLDSVTPLHDLISKLNQQQTLYETYKGYWIGYNDLMFSIAVHADSAIEPLVQFVHRAKNAGAQCAALYTLHLIGIRCNIAGRTLEEFSNRKAREALLNLLASHDSLQPQIMVLLIRDPRTSDLPTLFHIMDSLQTDCWAITSGLLRYDLKNRPVAQDVPEKLLGTKISYAGHTNFISDGNICNALKKFSHQYSFVTAEDTLLHYNYEMTVRIGFDGNEVSLRSLVRFCSMTNYCFLGPNFQYDYKNGKINFCSAQTAKRLWLDWWKSQPTAYRDSLQTSYKKIGNRKY